MAGGFLAIGCFFSALSKNQVIAFVLSVVACAVLVFAGMPTTLNYLSTFLPRRLCLGRRGHELPGALRVDAAGRRAVQGPCVFCLSDRRVGLPLARSFWMKGRPANEPDTTSHSRCRPDPDHRLQRHQHLPEPGQAMKVDVTDQRHLHALRRDQGDSRQAQSADQGEAVLRQDGRDEGPGPDSLLQQLLRIREGPAARSTWRSPRAWCSWR